MELSCLLGTTRVVSQGKFPQSHTINPLLTKLVWSRWQDISLVLFFLRLYGPRLRYGPSTRKKELGQYPAILTSHLVNNPYIYITVKNNYKLQDYRLDVIHQVKHGLAHILEDNHTCMIQEFPLTRSERVQGSKNSLARLQGLEKVFIWLVNMKPIERLTGRSKMINLMPSISVRHWALHLSLSAARSAFQLAL